jgi:hypothetical protein
MPKTNKTISTYSRLFWGVSILLTSPCLGDETSTSSQMQTLPDPYVAYYQKPSVTFCSVAVCYRGTFVRTFQKVKFTAVPYDVDYIGRILRLPKRDDGGWYYTAARPGGKVDETTDKEQCFHLTSAFQVQGDSSNPKYDETELGKMEEAACQASKKRVTDELWEQSFAGLYKSAEISEGPTTPSTGDWADWKFQDLYIVDQVLNGNNRYFFKPTVKARDYLENTCQCQTLTPRNQGKRVLRRRKNALVSCDLPATGFVSEEETEGRFTVFSRNPVQIGTTYEKVELGRYTDFGLFAGVRDKDLEDTSEDAVKRAAETAYRSLKEKALKWFTSTCAAANGRPVVCLQDEPEKMKSSIGYAIRANDRGGKEKLRLGCESSSQGLLKDTVSDSVD